MSQQNKKHLTNSKTMDPTTFIYMYVFETKGTFPYGQQSYIYQVLQTIQMKLILLCVWADPAVLGSAKTALKFIYKI